MGAKIKPILTTLPHRTPRALCGSVEKNTDSLVRGMVLFDQGGGREGRGEKIMVESAPPRQSVVRLFFLSFLRSSSLFFALRKSSNFEFPARIKKGGGRSTGPPNMKSL